MMKLLMVEDAAQEYRIKGTHFMSSMQIEWAGSKDFILIGFPAKTSKNQEILSEFAHKSRSLMGSNFPPKLKWLFLKV